MIGLFRTISTGDPVTRRHSLETRRLWANARLLVQPSAQRQTQRDFGGLQEAGRVLGGLQHLCCGDGFEQKEGRCVRGRRKECFALRAVRPIPGRPGGQRGPIGGVCSWAWKQRIFKVRSAQTVV